LGTLNFLKTIWSIHPTWVGLCQVPSVVRKGSTIDKQADCKIKRQRF
jgi:hypothetical protein